MPKVSSTDVHAPRWRFGVAIVGLALVLALTVPVGQQHVLVVTDESGDKVITAPVSPGDTVVLEYTHSVEKTTVRDVYAVRPGGLVMTEMEFQSYGAGLPATAPINITERGTFVRDMPADDPRSVRVATGEIADHDLYVGETRYDLAGRAAGQSVTITIETTVSL